MYQGLLHLHNVGRWVVIILLLTALIKAISGLSGDKPFTSGDKKVGLFLMIAAHIMLLIGLYQWFAGPWGLQNIQSKGMKAIMQDNVFRFWAVEHITGMLIAIILITIGKGSAKKNISDKAKHRRSFWFYFIALVIILATVPWPFREVARPLFPGMQ
ncbi:hypothetical protein [Segetibacter aerophilus]|uniref:Cytochrome B n=1 Tax=Segetibacter aerophilus TaxID=670293 RepID=A0A512B902_9BACT|nr:hypothetical protein [Segetibacter aerophilus]GEO08441.1 hypothetical protein SAE01_09370 [Segetibacter aerophilus]